MASLTSAFSFGGHHAGEPGDFLRVLQAVLAVGRPELHPADQLDQLGMQPVHADLEAGLLAFFLEVLVHLLLDLLDDFLDARRMDPPVGDQDLQAAPRDLASIRVVRRDQHGLGRVVHDEVDAGVLLERPDVAALAPDDAALHVVGGKIHDGDRGLHRVVRGEALDGRREHLARLHLRSLARFLFEAHRDQLRLAARLGLHLREELPLGFLGREAGDRLELAPLLVERGREPAFLLADRLLAAGQVAVLRDGFVQASLELLELARELFFLGEHTLLDLLDLALALPRFRLERRARLERGFLGFEVGGLETVGGVALGITNDAFGLVPRVADLPLADPLVEEEADDEGKDRDDRVGNEPNPLHCRSIGGVERGSQIPASAVCRGVSNLVSPGGRR